MIQYRYNWRRHTVFTFFVIPMNESGMKLTIVTTRRLEAWQRLLLDLRTI